MPFLITLFIIFIVILLISLYVQVQNKRYNKFVEENSQALKELKILNEKYKFYDIFRYIENHTYDNEKFYDNISCEDYLIYQLQFNQSQIKQEIGRSNFNKKYYSLYCEELSKIKCFGQYDKPTNDYIEKKLNSIETARFNQNVRRPITEFTATVLLRCSKINGDVYRRKTATFNSQELNIYIQRLNKRSGGFYQDRGVWESICKVERGKVSNKMRFSIYKRDGYRCRICGRTDRFENLEIDHIKPIAKGGKSTYDNLQTLCRRCNKEKGDTYYE